MKKTIDQIIEDYEWIFLHRKILPKKISKIIEIKEELIDKLVIYGEHTRKRKMSAADYLLKQHLQIHFSEIIGEFRNFYDKMGRTLL